MSVALCKRTAQDALEDLANWLLTEGYSMYKVEDLRPGRSVGFLQTVKPCHCTYGMYSGYMVGWPSGKEQTHYHTLDLYGEYRKGYGRGPNAFYRAVNAALMEIHPNWQDELRAIGEPHD